MKIRHSDRRWLGTLLVVVVVAFLVFSIIFSINLFRNKRNKQAEENLLTTSDYVVFEVVDYEYDGLAMPDVWQKKYDLLDSKTTLYHNDEKVRELKNIGLDEIVIFEPEKKSEKQDFGEKLDEHNKQNTGILYEFDMKTTEEYVSSLIQEGYSLVRKVSSPQYAEAYLKDKQGNIIRVMALEEYMLMAELDEGVQLKKAEEYFN